MRLCSPRLAGLLRTPAAPRGMRASLRRGALALGALVLPAGLAAGCHGEPPPVAPGTPIAAPTEVTLGTMDVECEALLTALGLFKQCPNLDEDDRADIDAWGERARQDFAAGKKANPEPSAQHAIAAACRKAVASVTAAGERCRAGPQPKD
jgi:hypothetical protein